MEHIDDNRLKTKHITYKKQLVIKDKPSFFKILKKARNNQDTFAERNPRLVRLLELKMSIKD